MGSETEGTKSNIACIEETFKKTFLKNIQWKWNYIWNETSF
jgi:hypothetical protein